VNFFLYPNLRAYLGNTNLERAIWFKKLDSYSILVVDIRLLESILG